MAAHQASPSLRFSRQEHWSGLPFPSPVHESESEVTQSCPTLSDPWTAAFQAPLSLGFFRQEYWSGVPLPSLDCVIRLLIDASDSSMVIAWYPITVTQYSSGLGRVQSGSWTLTNIMGINYLEGGETGKWTLEGEGDRIVTRAVRSAGAVA